MTTTKSKKKPATGMVRSLNIPMEVRDLVRTEAQRRGISAGELYRIIIQEYVDGALVVPTQPGPEIVGTSVWIKPELWDRFTAKAEREGHPSQWVFRSWLDRERDVA